MLNSAVSPEIYRLLESSPCRNMLCTYWNFPNCTIIHIIYTLIENAIESFDRKLGKFFHV